VWNATDGYSLSNLIVGSVLAAAALAVASGPELLHGVQRRRREADTVANPVRDSVVERKSASL